MEGLSLGFRVEGLIWGLVLEFRASGVGLIGLRGPQLGGFWRFSLRLRGAPSAFEFAFSLGVGWGGGGLGGFRLIIRVGYPKCGCSCGAHWLSVPGMSIGPHMAELWSCSLGTEVVLCFICPSA